MEHLPSRVALVYDRVNKWGGAEQVLLALHELFPAAPLFTGVSNPRTALWSQVFPRVIPTFIQHFPFASSHHEYYPWLMPVGFESLSFSGFDAVISVTSADAKGIITSPNTFHLCYCLTPTRYLWSHENFYSGRMPAGLRTLARPVFSYLKSWDLIAAQRPDAIVSISKTVQNRVRQYYHLDSPVVYPPVATAQFAASKPQVVPSPYFLYVGRLVAYKRPDVVVAAFNQLNVPLVVVGVGGLSSRLKAMAKPHIRFLDYVAPDELAGLYQHCEALIFFHEEDFGLVAVEAQAAGAPVIALRKGGASEIVVPGTGVLIDSDSPRALQTVVESWPKYRFDPKFIQKHASNFSKAHFNQKFVKVMSTLWTAWQRTLTS